MNKRTNQYRIVWMLVVLVIVGISIFPFFRQGFFMTDDGDWMIIRLSAFYQSLREGQFPVRFLGRLNFSYGYPVANFLYPGFMYIGSILALAGFTFENSVKIIMGTSLVFTGLFGFLWLSNFFTPASSAIGAISISLAPYLLFDTYKRGSVGELLATAIAVMCLWSIEAKKRGIFPLLFALLLVSHNTYAFLFSIVLLLYMFFRKTWWLIYGFILGLGMACFFWIPAMIERQYVLFDQTSVSNPFMYFASGETMYLINAIQIIMTCTWVIFIRKKNAFEIFLATIFFLSVFFASSMSAPFWAYAPIARIIQFPYRFLGISCITGAYFVSRVISEWIKIGIVISVIIVLISVISALSVILPVKQIIRPDGFYSTNEATTTVADEYLPKWISARPKERTYDRVTWYTGSGTIVPRILTTQTIDAQVTANEPSVLQINSIYYPGWGVAIDGISQKIDYQSTDGIIRVRIPTGTHTVYAQFRETIVRFIADMISVIACIGYGVYLWMHRFSKRKP